MSTPGAARSDSGFIGTGSAELEAGELAVFELVAIGAPLEVTLDALARLFESEAEGMLASVLAVKDGKVRHVAAPTLPRGWAELVDGQPIGPDQGSCGTAAYLKEPVMVADIANDRVRLSVADEGAGIAPEARARIFEKFGRVTGGAPERFHSAGLGLAFSKLAIEAHGGNIGLDAREPRGSVFWFELPR
jgi:hypothetical protein